MSEINGPWSAFEGDEVLVAPSDAELSSSAASGSVDGSRQVDLPVPQVGASGDERRSWPAGFAADGVRLGGASCDRSAG